VLWAVNNVINYNKMDKIMHSIKTNISLFTCVGLKLHRIRNINTNVYIINHVSVTVLTTGRGRRGRMVELA
jgi:hypothetical protein